MNPLIKKRLLKLWDGYHKAEKAYGINGYWDISDMMYASFRLAEVTCRFSTDELLANIKDWDFVLWLRNDEAIVCRDKHIKRPNRDKLPIIEWDGRTVPTLR